MVNHVYSVDFERFWTVFARRRRCKKLLAWKSWQEAILLAAPEDIIDSAQAYAESPLGRSKYAQTPAYWLNQGRWDDDPLSWEHGDDDQPKATVPNASFRIRGAT